MRATVTGLAVAVLLAAGLLAHADPYFGGPPPTCNPSFYTANGNCWYGPNYCYRGPCLPPAPFNGLLPLPQCRPPAGPPAGPPGLAGFVSHPYARSPRDFFMYGQTTND